MKELLDAGELAGPRLFVAGPIFTAPGGHPTSGGRDPNPAGVGGPMAFQSNDPDEIRREIRLLASQGADGIKAVLHGTVSTEGDGLPTLSNESFEALVDEARSLDLWVAVHVGPEGETRQATSAGVTTIEHGVRHGNVVDPETVRALLEDAGVPPMDVLLAATRNGGRALGLGHVVVDRR